MAFVEDIIFVVGLTGLVYLITDELLLIASASHKHSSTKLGSSRIDFSSQKYYKDSAFNDIIEKDSIFNDTQEAKIDDFVQRECSGVGQSCDGEFNDEIEVGTSSHYCFDEKGYLSGGDELGDQAVDQNLEFSGLDQGVENLFDELSQRDEVMEDEENVCFNVGGDVDEDEEEGWEDDWEGVERTELEKQFGAAVAFVNSKNNADRFFGVESNVKMELYGLHKVAIEGICMKPQPMALKVYSRAKWTAWKQLENMSREEAMEKYITLLSRTIPAWMEDRHK